MLSATSFACSVPNCDVLTREQLSKAAVRQRINTQHTSPQQANTVVGRITAPLHALSIPCTSTQYLLGKHNLRKQKLHNRSAGSEPQPSPCTAVFTRLVVKLNVKRQDGLTTVSIPRTTNKYASCPESEDQGGVMPSNATLSLAASEMKRTGFFDLSAELRNHIYHLALVQDSPIRMCWLHRENKSDENCIQYQTYRKFNQPPLLGLCRQIHNEALAIFYGANVFQSNRGDTVVWWLQGIGKQNRSLIREIRGFAIDSPWETSWRASERAGWVEDHMQKMGAPLRRGVVRAPCVRLKVPDMMLWVSRDGHTVETAKAEMSASESGNLGSGRRLMS